MFPLILSTLPFLAPLVLLVPLSQTVLLLLSCYMYMNTHVYTCTDSHEPIIYVESRLHEWASEHGSKHLSVVLPTAGHIQIKEHQGGNAQCSRHPNHLSVIDCRWAKCWVVLCSLGESSRPGLQVLSVWCNEAARSCVQRHCNTGQMDWSAQVWYFGSTKLMLPFWLSFPFLLLALLNGSQRAKEEVGPSQTATGKTSSCLWPVDKGEEQIEYARA